MEFGATFDDDFFEKSPDKKEKVPLQYNAKICTSKLLSDEGIEEKSPTGNALKWFMDPHCTDDGNPDQLSNLRHQADFYYFSKKYEDASKIYLRCLDIVPVNNTTVKRECMENLSRSFLHMNQEEKSLEWALRLHDIAFTADQLLITWNLLAVVCHRLGKFAVLSTDLWQNVLQISKNILLSVFIHGYSEEMESLECCVDAHRFYPDLWLRFAHCHAGLVDIFLPDSGVTRTHKFSRETLCCPFHEKNHSLRITKCEDIAPSIGDISTKQTNCDIVYDLSSDCSTNDSLRQNTSSVSNSKCEVCDVGAQIVTACLLKARVLLETAHAHHRIFGSEKKAQLELKIAACLEALDMDPDFLEQASQMLRSDLMEDLKQNTENSETPVLETQECSKTEESHVLSEPREDSSCSQSVEQTQVTSES